MTRFMALGALVIGLGGCGVGYNSMVFATKSNAGLDIDSTPPTAQISLSRSEAVFAPAFERGMTPPVMASFRFEDEGLFSPRLGSAFAAGDAAVAMASLWDDEGPDDAASKDPAPYDSTLALSEEPDPPGEKHDLPSAGDVRPMIFGTDTSLGIKVAWSGLTASLPDTLRVGFNRKELAWAPVTYAAKRIAADGTEEWGHFVEAPSLLATVDAKVEAGSPTGSNFQYVQYFATGDAATHLAMEQAVRSAMMPRFDPVSAELVRGTGFVRAGGDPSADRLRAWLASDKGNRERLRRWLAGQGIEGSVTFVVNDGSMRAVRERAVADPALAVPMLPGSAGTP
jgi:hypothetical protein